VGLGIMKFNHIVIFLSLSAAIAAPASANWFEANEYGVNHKRLLGSTQSPTPDDLRAIGDSKLGAGKSYYFDPKKGHWYEVRPGRGSGDRSNAQSPPRSPAGGVSEPPNGH
jgi:hypothetical protein